MLTAYIAIGQHLRATVPTLRWIDLDKGQLYDPESFHSLIVPAVLIGLTDIAWRDTTSGHQQGAGSVTVKTIVHLPAQTHIDDPLCADSLKPLALAETVHASTLRVPGIVSRSQSRDYPIGNLHVFEQVYEGALKYAPTLTQKAVTVQINPFLINPNAL